MTEFIVESLADFEQAVTSSERICFFFSASWDAVSVQLADALGSGGVLAAPFEGRINVVALDLGDADVEALALELGVSAPGTAMLYRGGSKAATLAPATEATLAQAFQELNQGTCTQIVTTQEGGCVCRHRHSRAQKLLRAITGQLVIQEKHPGAASGGLKLHLFLQRVLCRTTHTHTRGSLPPNVAFFARVA
jgi:hypothetical protein